VEREGFEPEGPKSVVDAKHIAKRYAAEREGFEPEGPKSLVDARKRSFCGEGGIRTRRA